MSPIASYQYYEWPGNDILQLVNSLPVSYFYNIGATSPNVAIFGRVADSSGAPLPTATITASVLQASQATAQTATDGTYSLPPLPPGVYVLKASLAGYASSTRALTLNSATAQQNFTLALLPTSPATVQTTRQPSATFTPPPGGQMGSTLKIFNGTGFVAVDANNKPNPSLMTIILTHGWVPTVGGVPVFSNPGVESWPSDMALQLRAKYVPANTANILAWDWLDAAEGLAPPEGGTPEQGEALGKALLAVLGGNYSQNVHFLGHSLGTIVNAFAANYLHGDKIAPHQEISPTPWSSARTHVTLFDDAENGQAIFNGLAVGVFDPAAGAIVYDATQLQAWEPPMPVHKAWTDNYISLVGIAQSDAVNVVLQKAADFVGLNPAAMHTYPQEWYTNSIANPTISILGFQRSYEYNPSAFPPSDADFSPGSVYRQAVSAADPLILEPDPLGSLAYSQFLGVGADVVVQGSADAVQFAGDVVVEISDAAQAAGQAVSSGLNYAENAATQGGQAVVNVFQSAVLQLTLHTGPPTASQTGIALAHPNMPNPNDANPTNTPAMAWVPVQIPANAAAMAFDFTVSGDPVQDSLVFGIGETNLFSLQAQYVPTNTVSASRLIDVTAWKGQQVELFFGLMGGTSTNATLEVDNIRFYSLQPPSLSIQYTNGGIALSWPSSAAGYVLQSTTSLISPDWEPVTNVPAITPDSYLLTNSYPAQTTFFRLRSQ